MLPPDEDFPVTCEGTIDDDGLIVLADLLIDLYLAREAQQEDAQEAA